MPFGEILERTWKLIKNNPRVLWLFTFNLVTIVLAIPLQFVSSLAPTTYMTTPVLPLLFCSGLLVYVGITLYVSGLFSASVSLSVLKIENGETFPSIPDLLKQAHRYVGRVVGFSLLTSLAVLLILMVFFIPLIFLSFGQSQSSGALMLIPFCLMCLLFPVIFLVSPGLMFANLALVIENKTILDGLKRGWKVYTKNFWPVLGTYIGWVVISFIIGLIFSVPTFILQFSQGFPTPGVPYSPTEPGVMMTGLNIALTTVQGLANGLLGFFLFLVFAVYYFHLAKQMPGQPPAGEPLPESL